MVFLNLRSKKYTKKKKKKKHYTNLNAKFSKTRIPFGTEKQNTENWNTIHINTTKQTLTQEDKINEKNQEWKEKYITKRQEPRLEKSPVRNRKNKQMITIYPNLQHWIKWINLCKLEN